MRKLTILCGVLVASALVVTSAWGADNEPKKANKFQVTLVNAYDECTTGSVGGVTGGTTPLPACAAVDSSGSVCNFSEKGQGKVQAKAKDDIKLKILAKNLENCDGQTLQAVATIQATTNDCAGGFAPRCTSLTLENFPVPGATCLVAKGKCLIKTTVNTAAPGTLIPGSNTAIRLSGAGLLAGTTTIAVGGVLVP